MIRRILAAIRQLLSGALALPGDLFRWLCGSPGSATPLPEGFEEVADSQADELRQELETPVRERQTASRTLGSHVHAYAAGDGAIRDGFDFGCMPEHVGIALLTMPPENLARLTAAGPLACGRWALGQRSGIVGLPSPERDWLPAATGKPQDGERVLALFPAGETPSCTLLPRAA